MAGNDILRYIDSIARDKEIDPDSLIAGIEQAVAMAVARKYGIDDLIMSLDRESGEWVCNYEIDLEHEGRILAQAVKQAIIGRVREAERDVLYDEYEQRIGEIVTGTVQRFEGDTMIVNLGRNIWQHHDPVGMAKALRAVIHGNASPKDAMDLVVSGPAQG